MPAIIMSSLYLTCFAQNGQRSRKVSPQERWCILVASARPVAGGLVSISWSDAKTAGKSVHGRLVVDRAPVRIRTDSGGVVEGGLLEEQDVRLWLVHFVVLPAQTLRLLATVLCLRSYAYPYLRNAERPPLLLPQQLQGASRVEVVFGDDFEHLLRELHVTVLVLVVGISGCARQPRTQRATRSGTTHLAE
jgi:hypothetical protein